MVPNQESAVSVVHSVPVPLWKSYTRGLSYNKYCCASFLSPRSATPAFLSTLPPRSRELEDADDTDKATASARRC